MRRRSTRTSLPAGFPAIWSAVAVDLIGFGIVLPILPLYAEEFGGGPATGAAIVATFSAAQLVFAPLWGRLSDRVGRRPVLVLALVGSAVGSLVTGLAGALWLLFVGRVVDGASGTSYAVGQAAVSDLAQPAERPRLLGLLAAAFGLGFVLGPLIGSIAALGPRELPFLIAAGISFANAAFAWRTLPETHEAETGDAHKGDEAAGAPAPSLAERLAVARRDGIVRLLVAALVAMAAFSGFEATLALLADVRFELRDSSIFGLFASIGLAMILVQTRVVGPVVDALGESAALRVALLVDAAALAVLSLDGGWATFAPALALLVLGQGVVGPALSSSVVSRAGSARGEMLGLQQSAGALGRIVGPVGAGLLFEHAGVGWPYAIGAGLAVAAALAVPTRAATRQPVGQVATP